MRHTIKSNPAIEPKFKVGDIVEDRWYPLWGTGSILKVMKTRYKLSYPGAPTSMKDKDGNVTYDVPHANMFLNKVDVNKEPNACGWAVEGMYVKIVRKDIQPLDKRNKNKEGVITKIDGQYIYVTPLYEPKRSMELYIGEIKPGRGCENAKKDYDKRFNKALKALGKAFRKTT